MCCDFDWCQFWNGIIFDVLTAVLLTLAAYWIGRSKSARDMRQKYGKAAGVYTGHSLADDATIKPEILSNATITYVRDNILTISLTHPWSERTLTWEGEIIMELETAGSIVWRYVDLPKVDGKDALRFGFKRLMVRELQNEVHVYLVGDKAEGFGNEILVRRK